MATVGQQLLAPESGWYELKQSELNFVGSTWRDVVNGRTRGGVGSFKDTWTVGDYVEFSFKGSAFRIIGHTANNRSKSVKINIDGVEEIVSFYSEKTVDPALLYEKNNLSNDAHNVRITLDGHDGYMSIYTIDLLLPIKKLVLKNPSTNQHYSLAEKTLIPLPNTSDKNMILHGLEAGKEIQLDEAFDKIKYVNELSTTVNGESGKIVTMDLLAPTKKILKINEVR